MIEMEKQWRGLRGMHRMDGEETEFGIAMGRKYTTTHLWMQLLEQDKEKEEFTFKVGISDFARIEYGEILRVTLPHLDDGDFNPEEVGSAGVASNELGLDDLIVTIRFARDTLTIQPPFACEIIDLNGEVEAHPELVNDDAYGDGWLLIVKPHRYDEETFLEPDEYIELLEDL